MLLASSSRLKVKPRKRDRSSASSSDEPANRYNMLPVPQLSKSSLESDSFSANIDGPGCVDGTESPPRKPSVARLVDDSLGEACELDCAIQVRQRSPNRKIQSLTK